jgi:hypothetical protein
MTRNNVLLFTTAGMLIPSAIIVDHKCKQFEKAKPATSKQP